MSEKEVQIKRTSLVEHLGSRLQVRSFPAIGSSLLPLAQVEEEPGCACCLSHLASSFLGIHVPHPSRVYCLCLPLSMFLEGRSRMETLGTVYYDCSNVKLFVCVLSITIKSQK